HFLPLVPIARSAEEAGHVVAVAGQEAMIATIESAGFDAFPTGGASLLVTETRTPLLELDLDREAASLRDGFAGKIARARVGPLLTLCEKWRPDVLVRDETDFGAAVAAERLEIPHASVLCLAAGSLLTSELVAEPLDALRTEHGLPPD